MNLLKYLILGGLFLFVQGVCLAQLDITPWPIGKQAALSITFDDNCPGQFTHARPSLDQRGLKATFFVITGSSQCGNRNWDTLRSVAASGHEIGSHTVTHPQLQTLDTARIRAELENSYNEIRQEIANSPRLLTMAWPFGRGGGSSAKEDTIRQIASRYYFSARNAGSGNGWDAYNQYQNPFYKDYYRQLGTLLIGTGSTGAAVGQKIRDCLAAGGLMTLLYHGIETGGFNNIPITLFEEHLDTMLNHPALWVTPIGNLVKYHLERRSANINALNSAVGLYQFTVTDTLADDIYNQPLGFKFALSALGASGTPQVEVAGQAVAYAFNAAQDSIMFNAAPEDTVTISVPTSIRQIQLDKHMKLSPVPANDILSVSLETIRPKTAQWSMIDLSGRTIAEGLLDVSAKQTLLETKNLPNGVYRLMINADQYLFSQRFVVMH